MESPGKDAPRTDTWGEAPGRANGPAAAGPQALPPRFRRDRLLGSGGQADVCLAHDLELDQVVAIKLFRPDLDPVARERLRREVRLGRELSHPRLVRMFELVEAGDRLGVVMEWIPGGSLAERMRQGPLSVADVVRGGHEVLEALAFLHGKGVLHRDVKPSNVLVGADGGVRLADYGLARPIGEGSDLTRTSVTVGTPGFMSPEQLRGEEPTPASDLYGLGATLFQLLTGRAPFVGPSEFEVARQHLTDPPPSPRELRPDCPAWLARFVLRLLEKKPADRFASAGEALAALEGQRASVSPRARRRRVVVAASVVGVLALAVAGGWTFRSRGRGPVAVHVAPAGNVLRGQDAQGEEVFAIGFRSPVHRVQEVDFGPLGGPVTVVTAVPEALSGPDRLLPAEIAAVDRTGRLLFKANVEDLVLWWDFPYPKRVVPLVHPFDLTGDGVPELVVVANHRTYYPSAVLVYWPRQARWEQVMRGGGHIWQITGDTRNGAGRLLYFSAANTLGWVAVCGAVNVPPPGEGAGKERVPLTVQGDFGSPGGPSPLFTTLVAMPSQAPGTYPSWISATADGGLALGGDLGRVATLDRYGNPVPGPLAGLDRSQDRTAFLLAARRLADFATARTAAAVMEEAKEIRSRFAPLLDERPSRSTLALAEARALAASGDIAAGARALSAEIGPGNENVDLAWRLAHLEAVQGNLAEARRRAEEVIRAGASYRSEFDAPMLLMRLLVELRDRRPFGDVAAQFLEGSSITREKERFVAALHLRAHLFWDELGAEDLRTPSSTYVPEAEALSALARWRLGRTEAGDIEAAERGERENPDAMLEYRLARAAALLGLGRAREALEVVSGLVNVLGPRARVDFADRQSLDLAEAIRVKALGAAGEAARAREEALRLRARLRAGLLPRILVEEVIAGKGR